MKIVYVRTGNPSRNGVGFKAPLCNKAVMNVTEQYWNSDSAKLGHEKIIRRVSDLRLTDLRPGMRSRQTFPFGDLPATNIE